MFEFYEFFCGGGMVRAALSQADWLCRFANDFDHKKSAAYRKNWGGDTLLTEDVRKVETSHLPGSVDLAWASFPCQDLSLAGAGAGLKGDRSGTFWPFWKLMKGLSEEERAPKLIVLENVCGTLTSHHGKDFAAICASFQEAGYSFGALVIDAAQFVPHSRPRLFFIGVRGDIKIPDSLLQSGPSLAWHTKALRKAQASVPVKDRSKWVWWSLPLPPSRNRVFADLIEENPADVEWNTQAKTKELIGMMSDVNRIKLKAAMEFGSRKVGAIYKRTRFDSDGAKVQRAEVRFDDVAGCLRTPAGGSSRQLILVVDGGHVRSRLISGRETARLMGLPEDYVLPENYNEAYHLTGDGVVVPVVQHLAENIFEHILKESLPFQEVTHEPVTVRKKRQPSTNDRRIRGGAKGAGPYDWEPRAE